MRLSPRVLVAVFSFVSLFAAQSILAQCGVERWSVKTGTDADVGLVNLSTSTATTIVSLRGLTAPATLPANNRIQPTETTVFTLSATLTQYKLETDSDYHLVLSDSSGNTMIAEIPSPNCVGAGSPFGPGIQNARSEFDAKYTATSSFQTANVPVAIKGVGFFDFLHGQTGVAPNGMELHAVLDIVFNPSSTDFTIADSPTSLSLTQGTSGNSAVTTSVSGGFNSAVSLSATGLPSGATATFSPTSIAAPGSGSSTMTVSTASTTPAGTYTITITGSGGGKTHTTTLSLTVNPTGGGGGTEALTDGGFESATASTNSAPGWTGTSSVSGHNTIVVGTGNAHTGSANGYFGSANSETDTLTQTFSIPSTVSSASFTFWTNIVTQETTTSTAYDTLKVEIHNSSGTLLATPLTLSNLNATSDSNTTGTYFKPAAIDLSSYKGQTLQLVFRAATDSSLPTTFRIDDVSVALTTSSGDTTPPATSITAPAGGATVSGTTSVTASASDNVGVTKVEFYLDGSLQATDTATPYAWSWNTTATANGSHTLQSKAYDAAGNAGSSSTITVTVSNSTGSQQLLGNPGFENGSTNTAPWTTSSGVVNNSASEPPHAGTWDAWMDGYGSAHTDSILQTVTIPSTATTATLSFYLHVDTAETTTTAAYDTLKVQIRNSSGTVLATLATYSNLNHNTGYAQKSFNVLSYKGQTIQIYLVGTEDSTMQTSFVVDDFALNVQ
ncbi:MAG TPA: Ig-like domain-containing protein [Thermoanaerobaculia bacterium]|nr:Ig-like domain-containing protein [Thermoanaerobaculia bacterium]